MVATIASAEFVGAPEVNPNDCEGLGVGVGVGVGLEVGVGVELGVGVGVEVGVGVGATGVAVGATGVALGVSLGAKGLGVGVPLGVPLGVGLAVGVPLGTTFNGLAPTLGLLSPNGLLLGNLPTMVTGFKLAVNGELDGGVTDGFIGLTTFFRTSPLGSVTIVV